MKLTTALLAAVSLLGFDGAAHAQWKPTKPIEFVVTSGPGVTHRVACFNPPTPEEAVAGRPLRDGFKAAAPPEGKGDELTERAASTADLIGLEADITGEEGPISVDPSAGGLPILPDPDYRPHEHSHDHPHDH